MQWKSTRPLMQSQVTSNLEGDRTTATREKSRTIDCIGDTTHGYTEKDLETGLDTPHPLAEAIAHLEHHPDVPLLYAVDSGTCAGNMNLLLALRSRA
ncbi:hypothetical protein NDU88_001135 [Pleurodeles waltl]|uniref:Uncharacterized protein n=1 Tax=Pleurodeles waltl TaxID=8319 RepID=A0AAV7Q2S4_PLEWA|nr:hypothetical protein NDU88_001135 [Pleurodeles waltl]